MPETQHAHLSVPVHFLKQRGSEWPAWLWHKAGNKAIEELRFNAKPVPK